VRRFYDTVKKREGERLDLYIEDHQENSNASPH